MLVREFSCDIEFETHLRLVLVMKDERLRMVMVRTSKDMPNIFRKSIHLSERQTVFALYLQVSLTSTEVGSLIDADLFDRKT